MAVLSIPDKVKVRNFLERKAAELQVPVSWIKQVVNDAAQAIEDRLSSPATKTALSNDIDAATQPLGVTLTATQKKHLVAMVFSIKFDLDKN